MHLLYPHSRRTILHVGKMYFQTSSVFVYINLSRTTALFGASRWRHCSILKGHLLIWAPSELKDWIIQVQLWFSTHPRWGLKDQSIHAVDSFCHLRQVSGESHVQPCTPGGNPSNYQRVSCLAHQVQSVLPRGKSLRGNRKPTQARYGWWCVTIIIRGEMWLHEVMMRNVCHASCAKHHVL